ncbi:hypothetical protein [Flavobacterium sp.]|jgi:hypothetical protein|uniref:hypothetical protein n=1 Tax=Flavobacterium sp. TaxID=239 RepID=UPI0037BF0CD8
MYNKFMFLFVLLFSFSLWSQNATFEIKSSNLIFLNANPSNEAANNIEGSQYIIKEFSPSVFSCLSESTPPIRYNVFKEEMEFMQDDKLYYVEKNDKCIITLGNNSYKYFENYSKEKKGGYLMILNKLNDPKYILYKKEKVKFVPEYIPNSTYGKEKPASYVIDKSKYYISMPDGLTEFPKKKSELLKLFPNNQVSIESFLTDKKISFSQESNLIELIDFLNTL